MPPVSPVLDDLLNRWLIRGSDLRKEIAFQKDLIEPVALAANGNRLAMRERRRRDLRQLEKTVQNAQARWDERLSRVEEWKKGVTALQQEQALAKQVIRSTVWLQKARTYQDTFIRRLEHRADLIQAEHRVLHERMDAWHRGLEERAAAMQELLQKEESPAKPLYVSRARKQPETLFVIEQQRESTAIGQELHRLRRSLSQLAGRRQKAIAAVEHQAAGPRLLYEVHKQEILSALVGSGSLLQAHREAILSDALVYESGRSILRRLTEQANGLRCIEDIPKQYARGWKKLLRIR